MRRWEDGKVGILQHEKIGRWKDWDMEGLKGGKMGRWEGGDFGRLDVGTGVGGAWDRRAMPYNWRHGLLMNVGGGAPYAAARWSSSKAGDAPEAPDL
eukprot:gene14219-biopygen3612